ncbi:phosphotransferase [Micromonospora citrea]|uniref:phosphotransferase n=1 Tax=Micromonospora citrea TaxID=47855 RepID=UPI003C7482B3
MRDRPVGLTEAELTGALAEGWAVEARAVEFRPVGAGSHHWSVVDRAGTAWFLTVDDLGVRPADSDAAFARLTRAYGTALALHRHAGLDAVVAPTPDLGGAVLRRLTARYALSVFPLVDGSAGPFGPHRPEDRADVVDLLARLHRLTPVVAGVAGRADLVLPDRERLHEALRDLDREWTGGPYAERARMLLAAHAGHVGRLLADFDRRVERVRRTASDWVVTHGEPHPGNVLRTPAGLRLVDWDTVLLAPPERDLWMVTPAFARMLGAEPADDGDDLLARWSRATGRTVDPAALALYPSWWRLADIASYAAELRAPHGDGEDPAAALRHLAGALASGPD